MDKHLRPERLDIEVKSANAEKDYKHWLMTFTNYKDAVTAANANANPLALLINYVSSNVYHHIADETTYAAAIAKLERLYVKKKNVVFSRYMLVSRKQESGETIDDYTTDLRQLTKDCQFKAVSAEEYSDEMLLIAFVNGLSDTTIRQRLLETTDPTFDKAYDLARSLELAKRNCEKIDNTAFSASVSGSYEKKDHQPHSSNMSGSANNHRSKKKYRCYFCGDEECKVRSTCPALHAICGWCHKEGHFENDKDGNIICLAKKKHMARNKGKSAAIYTSYSGDPHITMATAGEHFNDKVLKTEEE